MLSREIANAKDIQRRRSELLNLEQVSNCDVAEYLEEKEKAWTQDSIQGCVDVAREKNAFEGDLFI